MLIAIDIGNSLINIGFFTDKGLLVQKIETHPIKTPERYTSILRDFLSDPEMGSGSAEKNTLGVIISSVVTGHTEVLAEACKGLMPEDLLILSPEIKTGLVFDVPRPEELGSDRIANAVAAYEFYRRPVAVVDFGTATTISVVGKDANYIGGAIMPGVRLMNESLAKGTSKLSEINLSLPGSALGTDTPMCIQSGLSYGIAGAVERLLQEMEKEVGFSLKVIVTGGYGGMVSRFLRREHSLKPNLTLEGLKIIYMRNKDA
ncbi:MAG: type III pantothenate kinase [Thermodesulfovibrionales bacterium]|nr:type III pantothenate kinase [Thermodesulfovibrionales bacterium]